MKFTKKYLDKKIHQSSRWFCTYTQSYKYTWFVGPFALVLDNGKLILLGTSDSYDLMSIESEEKLDKLIDFVNTV